MPCWFYRLLISHAADSDRDLGTPTRRHIARCAACRSFHEGWQTLGRDLRSAAADPGKISGPASGQVSHALARQPERSIPTSTGVKLVAAACLAVVASIGILAVMRPNRTAPPTRHQVPAIALTGTELATTWTRFMERPFADELENLSSDTKSSVRFLVACLDVSPVMAEATHPR